MLAEHLRLGQRLQVPGHPIGGDPPFLQNAGRGAEDPLQVELIVDLEDHPAARFQVVQVLTERLHRVEVVLHQSVATPLGRLRHRQG